MKVNFEVVSVKRTHVWVDPETGRKRQLSKTFFQTLNPWNIDSDGCAKSRGHILAELNRQGDAWFLRRQNDMRDLSQKYCCTQE